MSTNIGSCLAATLLFASTCRFTPQSPPETNENARVAFAGIVRNRYTGDTRPMRNSYSVPGHRPVNSARYTERSVGPLGVPKNDRITGNGFFAAVGPVS